MEETAPQAPAPGQPTRSGPFNRRRALIVGSIVAALFGATEFAASKILAVRVRTLAVPISVLLLLAMTAALLVSGAVVHYVQWWTAPMRRLEKAMGQIRRGDLPVDALPRETSGLEPLVAEIEVILKELKRQKGEVAQLELEMSQRIAQRTDALERMVGSMRAQATRDALTGLYNRRMLNDCLEQLVAKAAAERASLVAMMVDVDDFKLLNDTLVHAQGDDLLRAVGQLIRSSIRHDDLGFRCGGDEFLILMPGGARADAETLATRLTQLVDALTRPLELPRKPRLSIGLASLHELGPSPTSAALLQRADQALYAVKTARKGGKSPSQWRAA